MDPEIGVEIESSTDSMEDVKAALGEAVEIEDTAAPSKSKEEKPEEQKSKAAKASAAGDEPEEDGGEPAGDEEQPKEPAGDEEETPEEKPKEKEKPKTPSPTVPRARLNEEIARRKAAEAQLTAARTRKEEPEEKPAAPVAEEPQLFSGKPEPTLEQFTTDVDPFDSKAMAEATGKFAKAFGAWSREEARAEADYRSRQEKLREQQEAIDKPFREREAKAIERIPDYVEIVKKSTVDVSDFMADFARESEVGPEILYHLTINPQTAERIRGLRAKGQSTEMQALETRIKKEIAADASGDENEEEPPEEETPARVIPKKTVPPKAKTASNAPPPTPRVKTSGTQPKSLQELAGPADRTGIDIDFNPEYEKAVKAGRQT